MYELLRGMVKPMYLVIACIKQDNKLKGFRIVSETGKLDTLTLPEVRLNSKIKYMNAVYDPIYKTLVGTGRGLPLARYPVINMDYSIVANEGIIVQSKLLEKGTEELKGYVCYSSIGKKFKIALDKFPDLCKGRVCCNFELVNSEAESTMPCDFQVLYLEQKTTAEKEQIEESVYRSAPMEPNSIMIGHSDPTKLPNVGHCDFDNIKNYEFSTDAQKVFTLASANLRKLAPYYSCVFDSVPKQPAINLGTMCVTESKVLYDLDFIANLSVAECTFVDIHEMGHILMRHSLRVGKKDRRLWNIATDMYINSMLCDEFGIRHGDKEKTFTVTDPITGKTHRCVLKTPQAGIFPDEFGIKIDLSRETPESIYATLVEQNPNGVISPQQQQNQQGQQGQQSQQNQQGQQGQQDGDSTSESEQMGGQNGSGGLGSESEEFTDSGDLNSSSDSSGQPNESDSESGDGQSKFNSDNEDSELKDDTSQGKVSGIERVSVVYNGQRIEADLPIDICSDDSSGTPEAEEKNRESAKNTLQGAKTKVQLEEQKLGEALKNQFGNGGALVRRYIDFGLAGDVDWRVLLKNVAKTKGKKSYTLALPQQDYMNMGITLASRELKKKTKMTNIVIGVDVSGSVSDKALRKILSEIANLLRMMDVNIILVYWSTNIGDFGEIEKLQDLLKVNTHSTGGTDVRCLFEFLNREITCCDGRTFPIAPKDINALVIITDGDFSKNYSNYALGFMKKTIWLIDGSPVTFDNAFGKVYKLLV